MSATFKVTSPARDRRRLPDRQGRVDDAATADAIRHGHRKGPERSSGQDQRSSLRHRPNPTDQFIELYNASASAVDLSNWSLIHTPSQWAPVKLATIPAGTKLARRRLLPARPLQFGAGSSRKRGRRPPSMSEAPPASRRARRSISTARPARSSSVGTAATAPDDAVRSRCPRGRGSLSPPARPTCLSANAAGFEVGQKIGIDIGGNYELATVTAVGKAATQTTLVSSGERGRDQHSGRGRANMTAGDTLTVGTGATQGTRSTSRASAPAQARGVDLAAPLKFNHTAGRSMCPTWGRGSASRRPRNSRTSAATRCRRWAAASRSTAPVEEPRVWRAGGQPAGDDGGIPGAAGAQSVVRGRALRQGRLDRTDGRQRRGGRRRHGLRIPAK